MIVIFSSIGYLYGRNIPQLHERFISEVYQNSQAGITHLPGVADDRFLVLADKVAATPPKYPRKAGISMKTPLYGQ